jgi:hypothetical protein
MRGVGAFRQVLVWLAVAATPVAAAPRVTCVCPGEKPVTGRGDCCLKDFAPSSAEVGDYSAKHCCKPSRPTGGQPISTVSSPRCHTALVDAAAATVVPPDDSTNWFATAQPFDCISVAESQIDTSSFMRRPQAPPPTDRVVVFCHFVI